MKSEIVVFKSRNLVLQRLADHVVHGNSHYCAGTVPVNRCAKLIAKFDLYYNILADRNKRARRKRADLGNAAMLLLHNGEVIQWWLLVTKPSGGDHPAHHLEKLRDANDKLGRIEIDGYELVCLPKKGSEGTKFTWRMTARAYQNWRDYIIDTVRSGSVTAMHRMLYQLWSVPGFAGIRSQVGHLVALYRSEVKRASRKDAPLPPKRLPYIRRLKDHGVSLTLLMREINAQSRATLKSCEQAEIQPKFLQIHEATHDCNEKSK